MTSSSRFAAQRGRRRVVRDAKQPSGHRRIARYRPIPRERQEDRLGNVFGELWVANAPKRGCVNPPTVSRDQSRECRLIAAASISAEQFGIAAWIVSLDIGHHSFV